MKRLKVAGGIAGFMLFIKIFALSVGENLLHQWLGMQFGITVETILLSAVFALILWFMITKRR